ncbi:hypothetical protein EMCRGX_G030972 [Ephydatia muelleri]
MDVEARLVTLVSWIAMGAMVFGGIVPFIPQYRKIKLKRSTEGFSTFVCLVLLLANIMRILFWVGKRYEYPLLAQSVVMVLAMIALMHLCVKVEREVSPGVARRISDYSSVDYFWKWTEFSDYILFITLFTVFGGVVTLVLRNVQLYVELLGFASLMTEAMLGVPQFWKNFQMKSTSGMSVQMVLLWFSGDMFKTTYFIVRHSPAQFWRQKGAVDPQREHTHHQN